MATTVLSQGVRNPKTGFAAYGGAQAFGDGVTDDTQAIRDALYIGGFSGALQNNWSPRYVYLPPGTYVLTSVLVLRCPYVFFGEPSARPKLQLKANSPFYASGTNPFIVNDSGWNHNGTDYTTWAARGSYQGQTYSSTNDMYNSYFRDIDVEVLAGNPGCNIGVCWNGAQGIAYRNSVITVTNQQATALQWGVFAAPTAIDGGSGGGIVANITTNGGQSALTEAGGSYANFRGCTFNGAVTFQFVGQHTMVACAINNSGGAGFNNGGTRLTMDDCPFSTGTPFVRSGVYHIENSGPPPVIIQETGGTVYLDDVSVSGTDSRLNAAGVVKGSPWANPAYPYAPSNTVNITAAPYNAQSGQDCTNAFLSAFSVAGQSVYCPPGSYTISSTITIGANQRLYGNSAGACTILCTNGAVIAVTGNGVGPAVVVDVKITGNSAAQLMTWNADPASQMLDVWLNPQLSSTGPVVSFQSGGGFIEQGLWVADGSPAMDQGALITSTTGPFYFYAVAPEHYSIHPWSLVNAQNVFIRALDFEVLDSRSHIVDISGGSNINIGGIIAGPGNNTSTNFLVTLTNNPKVSLWETYNYNGTSGGLVWENSVTYGSGANGSALGGFIHPSAVANTIPSVGVSQATSVGLTSATLNGSILSTGNQTITADGFDYGTTTSYGTHVVATTVQSGSFSFNLTGLTTGTTYHYRATAVNASGTGVSVDSQFVPAPPPPFIQGNINNISSTSGGVTTTSVTLNTQQTSGNSNVVAISFNNVNATISSVTDTKLNVYQVASPLTLSATDAQAIWWCPSISGTAGLNSITVNLSVSSAFVSVRAAEYHGLGAIDIHREGTSVSLGVGTTASVPNATTTNINDIIIVAANAGDLVTVPAPGFVDRMNANPFGSDFQDNSPGVIYNSTAPTTLNSSTNWIENLVAFLPSGAASVPSLAVPTATSVANTTVTLNGSISSNGGQTILNDGFDYGTTASYGTHVTATTVQSGAFTFNVTGLTVGTLYHFRATAANATGTGLSTDQMFTTTGGSNIPTLVQHVSSSTNYNAPDGNPNGSPGGIPHAGNVFHFNLPNLSLSGNCLIFQVSGGNLSAPTVSDNTGLNTWTLVNSTNGNGIRTSLFVALNAAVGTEKLVISFNAPTWNAHFQCSEFCNVSAIDGNSVLHNTGTASLSSGTISAVPAGDLIWTGGFDTSNSTEHFTDNLSSITAGTGYSLLSSDIFLGTFSQYSTSVSGNVTPTATLNGGNIDGYNVVSVALRSAAQGNPAPAGIRVLRIQSLFCVTQKAIQFPSSGNLIYVTCAFDTTLAPLTFPAGWTKLPPVFAQGAYISNANSPTLSFTITGMLTGALQMSQLMLYDISGAAASPFDNWQSGGTLNFTGSGDYNWCVITPTTANGLLIATLAIGVAVVSQPTAATTTITDNCWYDTEWGGDTMNNADGFSHLYNAPANVQSIFTWGVVTPGAEQISGFSVAFKAASVANTVPSMAVSQATNVLAASATLNGSIVSNGGLTITTDGFDWGTTTGYGNHVNASVVQSGAFSAGISGLTGGTLYNFRSTATNSLGTGVSTNQTFQFVAATPTVPAGFTATPTSISSITLNWTISTGGTGAIHYEIWSHTHLTAYALKITTSTGAITANDTGLTSGNLYFYEIRAVDSVGSQSAFSTTITAPTYASFPGTVFASNYNIGGQNVGYFDNQGQNIGTGRSDGVDLKATSDAPDGSGFVLGFRTAGEWTKYNVTVASTGTYSVAVRYESAVATGQFHILDGATTIIPSVIMAATGPFDTLSSWVTTALGNVTLTSGDHVLQVMIDNQFIDFNFFSFSTAFAPGWLAQLLALKSAAPSGGFAIVGAAIPSLETFGLPKAIQPSITLLSGISSVAAFGALTLSSGNVSVLEAPWIFDGVVGIPLSVAVTGSATISGSGITTKEAFGIPSFAFSTVTVSLSGIASAQAFGFPTFQEGNSFLFISSVPDASAIGSLTIFQPGAQFISQPIITSSESFGTPTIFQSLQANLQGVISAESFGTPTIDPGNVSISLSGQGIGSQESLGLMHVAVFGNVDVFLAPVLSSETFGALNASGSGNDNLSLAAINSLEVVNNPNITQVGSPFIIPGRAIDSLEAFGFIHTSLGIATISLSGIPSVEVLGIPRISFPGGPRHMGRVL